MIDRIDDNKLIFSSSMYVNSGVFYFIIPSIFRDFLISETEIIKASPRIFGKARLTEMF
jgi:hypothetical protein